MKNYFSFIKRKWELILVIILLVAALIPRIITFKSYIYAPPSIGADGGLMAYEIENRLFMRNAGYPGFALIASYFDTISPFSVDINLSLISLIFGIGSILLFYLFSKKIVKNIYLAWVSSLIYAFLPVAVYIHSTQEIYSIQAFFLLLSIVLLMSQNSFKRIFLSGIFFGLAVTIHFSSNFALPFLALFFPWYYRSEFKASWKEIFKRIGQWFLGFGLIFLVIFGWMEYRIRLELKQFIAQMGGDVGLRIYDRIESFINHIKQPQTDSGPSTNINTISFFKISWSYFFPRLKTSFTDYFPSIIAVMTIFLIIFSRFRFLVVSLIVLTLTSIYFELDVNPGGDNGRFIVMLTPALLLIFALTLKTIGDFYPKKIFLKIAQPALIIISLLFLGYLIKASIDGKWVYEKGLAKMYRERKEYYLWLKNNVPHNSVFIEDTHMPQDGAFYNGPNVIYDDNGNLGILEDYDNKRPWQLTKMIWRFSPDELTNLIKNKTSIYSSSQAILSRILSRFTMAEKLANTIKKYDDFSTPEARNFISSFKTSAEDGSNVDIENDKLVINLKQKVDDKKYNSVIIDIPNLNMEPEGTNLFSINLKMLAHPDQNEHIPKTNMVVNFYEKGKTNADFAFQKEFIYDKNEPEQNVKLNIRDQSAGKTIDRIHIHASNYWEQHYNGETKIIINSIEFDHSPKWYEIKEIGQEPKAKTPVYQVIFSPEIEKELDKNPIVTFDNGHFVYQDDFKSYNWIADSSFRNAIERRGNALMPKLHLRPGEIIYSYEAEKPIKEIKIDPNIYFNDLVLDPPGSNKSYFKIFVRQDGKDWQEAYSIFSNKNKSENLSPSIDLTNLLSGSKKGEIKIMMYSWHISKFQHRGGYNSQLQRLKIEGETE